MKRILIILPFLISCYGTHKMPVYNTREKTIGLYADKSYDPDGYIVTYQWKQIAGPSIKINGYNAIAATVLLKPGTYTFELTVTDNQGASGRDTAVIKY